MIDGYADRWALVTGASSGIGAEFARLLAARGMHLVLAARRKDRLEQLAEELHTRHGTISDVVPCDLADPGGPDQLISAVERQGRTIELLVNNAGYAVVSDIANTDPANVLRMLRVNIAALTQLTYQFLPGMLERGHGAIINLSSVAGLQPVAYMGAYAASKAYVLHFSEALWAELRGTGVSVMGLCPGATATEFFEVAGVKGWLKKRHSHEPSYVARKALRALERKRPVAVVGWWNRLRAFFVRLASRKRVVIETLKYFRPRKSKRTSESEPPTSTTSTEAEEQRPQSVR